MVGVENVDVNCKTSNSKLNKNKKQLNAEGKLEECDGASGPDFESNAGSLLLSENVDRTPTRHHRISQLAVPKSPLPSSSQPQAEERVSVMERVSFYEQQQKRNVEEKRSRRLLATVVLGFALDSDLPCEFYESIGNSKQFLNITKNIVRYTNQKNTLLEFCNAE